MRVRTVAVAAILGIVFLLLLSSAAPARAAHGDMSGLYGGTFRVAVQGALNLNPFQATDADSWKVIPLVYDSLARIDPVTLVPTPWAAESWSMSGTTLTVTLRSDVTFHDGSPLTATDVLYSYNQYKTAGLAPADLSVGGTGATVTLSSATAGGRVYGQGLTLPIVKSGTATNPVGGGPWELTASSASSWTLTANADHFWPPYLETLTFSVYSSTTTAAEALLNGTLDFIGWPLLVDEPSAIIDVDGVNMTLLADASIVQNPGLQQLAFGFNLNAGHVTSDTALRQALAQTLHPILYGQIYPNTIVSTSPIIPEDVPWYNPSVPIYQVLVNALAGDVGRSSALLTESLALLDAGGYVDLDADGWRESPTGAQLSVTVIGRPVEEDPRQFTIQEAATDVFTRLGIRASLVSVPSSQIEARIGSGNYDVFVHRFDSQLDPGFMADYFHSTGTRNWFDLADTTLDGYLASADAALDPAARKTAVWNAQARGMSLGVFIPVLHFNAIEATVRGAFDGWVNTPGGVNNFWTYQMLHVPQAGSLDADVTLVPNSVASGGTTTAIARVFDASGAPVSGATVTFWIGGAQVGTAGSTDPSGSVSRSITAPTVDGATDVTVSIQATKLGYGGSDASAMMTVMPVVRALSVAVASSLVTIASGESASITVTVTSGGSAVSGATVSIEVVGLGGRVVSYRGTTDAQGRFATTFTADVGPRTQFRIVALATMDGYSDGSGSTTVVVEQRVGGVEPRLTGGLDIGTIAIAVIALAVIAAVAMMAARRK